MNKQIELLARQAGAAVQPGGELLFFGNTSIEKFAQLIVRECISINRQRMFSEWEGDSHRVAHNNALLCATSDMFEHFGVEE